MGLSLVTGGRVERRLAAVLAADVAGYSRLMGTDEVGTARTLREHRVVTDALVARHGGRIVKTTGDGVLLEFPSVVDAVECAVAVQTVMVERNEGVPADRRMLFRIGINLGDILIEGDDILGDGVNVAARLEGIAEPGGICISSSAYEQVQGKVAVEFTDMGEQSLKNIARPIRALAVRGKFELATSSKRTTLPLPEKPSIAVLPFQNMSGDPDQEYFADGMVEDIITALSSGGARGRSLGWKGRTWCRVILMPMAEGCARRAGVGKPLELAAVALGEPYGTSGPATSLADPSQFGPNAKPVLACGLLRAFVLIHPFENT
jgi:class 3 adenylate cyclase